MRHFNETLLKYGCAPAELREVPYGDRGALDAYFRQVEAQFDIDPRELDATPDKGVEND